MIIDSKHGHSKIIQEVIEFIEDLPKGEDRKVLPKGCVVRFGACITQSEYDHAVGIHVTFDGTRFFASAYVVAPGRPRIHLVTTTPLRSTTPWDIENEVVQLANEIFGSLARLNQE